MTKPNSDTIEFKYYATGKRAEKIVAVGSTVTTYKYHWDGDLPVKIEETTGETTTSTYFTFRKPGDILTMTYDNNTYFYVQNIRQFS